ncbi:hypothetical protein D3C87_1116650 [compost metagenome]
MEDVMTMPATDAASLRKMKALSCLNTLQMCAARNTVINYETLALMMGLPSQGNALANAVSPILYDVYDWCVEAGLPHLTVLVVRKSGKDKGLPGPGFWKVYRPDQQLTLVERVEFTEVETAKCFRLYEKLGA